MQLERQYFRISYVTNITNLIHVSIPSTTDLPELTSMQYSTDNGSTWVNCQRSSNSVAVTDITIPSGGVILKGVGTTLGKDASTHCRIYGDTLSFPLSLSGNIMSLLYGDNFYDKTTLEAPYTFYGLFEDTWVNNTKRLILPATTLAAWCYARMFARVTTPSSHVNFTNGCIYILPAESTTTGCYSQMFYNGKQIKIAPFILANDKASYAFKEMFYGCSRLEEVTINNDTINTNDAFTDWLYGVAASGTIYSNYGMQPSGWEWKKFTMPIYVNGAFKYIDKLMYDDNHPDMRHNENDCSQLMKNNEVVRGLVDTTPYDKTWLTVEALEQGTLTINIPHESDFMVEYSIDNSAWVHEIADGHDLNISVSRGDKVSLRAHEFDDLNTYRSYNSSTGKYVVRASRPQIKTNFKYNVYGNIESLFSDYNFIAKSSIGRELNALFREDGPTITILTNNPQAGDSGAQKAEDDEKSGYYSYLIDASNLVFNLAEQTTITMTDSTSLTTSPGGNMFSRCRRMVNMPLNKWVTLPKKLNGMLINMFSECYCIKTCDWVIDGTINNGSFDSMFWWCIDLLKAPEIIRVRYDVGNVYGGQNGSPKQLRFGSIDINDGYRCFHNMFYNCPNMLKGPMIFADYNYNSGYPGTTSEMFFNCQSMREVGIFKCKWLYDSSQQDYSETTQTNTGTRDPFTLNRTGRVSQITDGLWESNLSSIGTLVVHTNILPYPTGVEGMDWSTNNNIVIDGSMWSRDEIISKYGKENLR